MNALMERLGLHGNDREAPQQPPPEEATARSRREHVLAIVFYRFAELYDKTFYRTLRRFTEFSMLVHSLLAFSTLTALHFAYINNPTTSNCFSKVNISPDHPIILRIEVKRPDMGPASPEPPGVGTGCCDCDPSYKYSHAKDQVLHTNVTYNATFSDEVPSHWFDNLYNIQGKMFTWLDVLNIKVDQMSEKLLDYFSRPSGLVVEYSESSGLLLLSEETRKKLGVQVFVLTLDPDLNKCFGTDVYKKVFMEELFGFRDVVTISLENFLISKNMTEGYYKVSDGPITKLNTERTTPLPRTIIAAISMVIFVAFSSLLLQFCYNTLSSAVVDLIYFNNGLGSLPIGPIMVSIIAIIGFRDLMKYMFYDNVTFTLNLLVIWMANQFYTFFCHCSMSKRHWLKFFFLYHFVFYVYYVRYKGRFSSLAMTTSWFFIQHSKMYFFHHYELPAMHSRLRVQRALAELRRNGSSVLDRLRFRAGREGSSSSSTSSNNNDNGNRRQINVDVNDSNNSNNGNRRHSSADGSDSNNNNNNNNNGTMRRNSINDVNDRNNNIISDMANTMPVNAPHLVGMGSPRVRLTFVLREPRR